MQHFAIIILFFASVPPPPPPQCRSQGQKCVAPEAAAEAEAAAVATAAHVCRYGDGGLEGEDEGGTTAEASDRSNARPFATLFLNIVNVVFPIE